VVPICNFIDLETFEILQHQVGLARTAESGVEQASYAGMNPGRRGPIPPAFLTFVLRSASFRIFTAALSSKRPSASRASHSVFIPFLGQWGLQTIRIQL
jgi:hypothetical protein